MPSKINSAHDFVQVMIEILFSGIVSKKGLRKGKNMYEEVPDRSISNYLKNPAKQFKESLREGLVNRVEYYLSSKSPYDKVLDENRFVDLLWILYEYAFGIDFYMLRLQEQDDRSTIDLKKWHWTELLTNTLTCFIKNDSVPVLKDTIHRQFHKLQLEMEKDKITRFTYDEIDFFRHQEVLGEAYYRHCDCDDIRWMDKDIFSLLKQMQQTVEMTPRLLEAINPERFHDSNNTNRRLDRSKWKEKLYLNMPDSMYITSKGLEDFQLYLCTCQAASSLYGKQITDLNQVADNLYKLYSELHNIINKYYVEPYRLKEPTALEQVNCAFIEGESFQLLYQTVQKSYKYLKFNQWVDANMKFI